MIEQSVVMLFGGEPDMLRKYCKGKRVLEIGAYEGHSTTIIAEVAEHITTIDTFEADCIFGITNHDTLSTYKKNTEKFDNVDYIVGNSRVVKPRFTYDILFIDGDHTFEGCWNDLNRFNPKEGYLVHDFSDINQFPGVTAACMKYFKRFPDDKENSLAYWCNTL